MSEWITTGHREEFTAKSGATAKVYADYKGIRWEVVYRGITISGLVAYIKLDDTFAEAKAACEKWLAIVQREVGG